MERITIDGVNIDYYADLITPMMNTPQSSAQTVFEHGVAVFKNTIKILSYIIKNQKPEGFVIPDWLTDNKTEIGGNLHELQTIIEYTLYHDCGKPLCLTVEEGKNHFPNHAEVSKELFLKTTGKETIANLIGWDMAFHSKTAEEFTDLFQVWTKADAYTFAIVGLAEVHANADLFGGIESTSFKIKLKHLCKRAKQTLKHYKG